MNENFIFNALKREKVGKGASHQLRRQNLIPASLYGSKKESVALAINPKELQSQITKSNLYINIYKIKFGKTIEEAIIRDIQYHPVKDTPIHIDFLRVGKDTITKLNIPVKLLNINKCPGIKLGGSLNFIAHFIVVSCNPKIAPKVVELDLSEATTGTVCKIENIQLPDGVKTYYPKGYAIYSITNPGNTEASETKE